MRPLPTEHGIDFARDMLSLQSDPPSPRTLGVPHPHWREHQYETYTNTIESDAPHFFLEAPMGSGKSALAAALGASQPVTVLVSTLGLLDQYHREYNFHIVKGRQAYPCVNQTLTSPWLEDMGIRRTAFDCPFSPMHKCPEAAHCPYLKAKHTAKDAQRVAVTYKYGFLSTWPREREGILVCDEAHSMAEEIIASNEFTISSWHQKTYDVPNPLRSHFMTSIQERVYDGHHLWYRLISYLRDCATATAHYRSAKDTPDNQRGLRFHNSLQMLLQTSLHQTEEWFLEVGTRVVRGKPGLRLRPLDARSIAGSLWYSKDKAVLMSATIGDPEPLAQELGIEDYDSYSAPHLIPPDKRPVDVVFNKKMTKRNRDAHPGLYKAQAIAISQWIQSLPDSWRGIILTTSYHKIGKLREHLSLNGRLWHPPRNLGLTERIDAFKESSDPGLVHVDTIQGWGQGLDLRGDMGRFVVIAGVPFYNPSDPYDRARMSRKGGMKYQRWLAYSRVMQASGRVTRGIRNDEGDYLLNRAALADGSALTTSAYRYYSKWFKDAIGKVER